MSLYILININFWKHSWRQT